MHVESILVERYTADDDEVDAVPDETFDEWQWIERLHERELGASVRNCRKNRA